MNLLRRVERHLRRSATPPTRFGREAVGDPRLVFDLRNGRTPRAPLHARIVRHLEAYESPRGGAR